MGIEIAPRNYDLASDRPFHAADIISMVPVYKSVACTTADGRQLLEQSKLALDKGKLDESVQSGCKVGANLCYPFLVECSNWHIQYGNPGCSSVTKLVSWSTPKVQARHRHGKLDKTVQSGAR